MSKAAATNWLALTCDAPDSTSTSCGSDAFRKWMRRLTTAAGGKPAALQRQLLVVPVAALLKLLTMQWVKRLIFLAILFGAGWLVWFFLFPSPEKVIHKRLRELSVAASFGPNEGELAKVSNAGKVSGFFTKDVEVVMDVRGYERQTLSGRDNLFQIATAVRTRLQGLDVEFLDQQIELGPNHQTARVSLTAKITIPGDRDFMVQELEFVMIRAGRDWLIRRVVTVRVLS